MTRARPAGIAPLRAPQRRPWQNTRLCRSQPRPRNRNPCSSPRQHEPHVASRCSTQCPGAGSPWPERAQRSLRASSTGSNRSSRCRLPSGLAFGREDLHSAPLLLSGPLLAPRTASLWDIPSDTGLVAHDSRAAHTRSNPSQSISSQSCPLGRQGLLGDAHLLHKWLKDAARVVPAMGAVNDLPATRAGADAASTTVGV